MAEAADVTSIVGWLATGGLIAWVTAFLTLRKDDRSVVIDNVTKERKDWRIYLRKWCAEVSALSISNEWNLRDYFRLKSELVTRLNPVDKNDYELINKYEKLIPIYKLRGVVIPLSKKEIIRLNPVRSLNIIKTIEELQKIIGCLLKQDWEDVKNECTPFYVKMISQEKFNRQCYSDEKSYLKVNYSYTSYSKLPDVQRDTIRKVRFPKYILVYVVLVGFLYLWLLLGQEIYSLRITW